MIEVYVVTNSTGDHALVLDNENRIAWWLNSPDSFESMVARFHFTTANEYFKTNNVPNVKIIGFYE